MRRVSFVVVLLGCAFAMCANAGAQALPEEAEGMSCEEPVLWIAKYGPNEFGKAYCAGCLPGRGESCSAEVQKRGRSVVLEPTERVEAGYTRVELGVCRQAAVQHQLIRAWHGRPVERAWKDVLESRFDWVGKRPRVSYPKSALPLLQKLGEIRSTCGRLEKKYAKYLHPVERFVRAGKAKTPIASEQDGWGGPGLSRRLLWKGARDASPSLTLYSDTQTLGNTLGEDDQSEVPTDPSDFSPGLSPQWRARTYVAVVRFGEAGGGFRCWGECEGGHSLDVFVDGAGEVVGQLSSFSACPFVYTAPEGTAGFVQQGEILRNLRQPELETTQTLPVVGEEEACEKGTLRVRLTEEKRELTYLDDVALRVGDVVLKPLSCGAEAHCADDGEYARLAEGEALELVFEIPEDLREACGDIELQADGYYVPL